MPVTLNVAPHDSNEIKYRSPIATPHPVIQSLPGDHAQNCDAILEGSIYDDLDGDHVYAEPSGFVKTAITAYNQHLHLRIRPDDIWISILTQLSFYVNKHSEDLRHLFVEHEGKKELVVSVEKEPGKQFGKFISKMSILIKDEIKDASFREWIMPDFSTSSAKDKTVCSVIMMGALKNYFDYVCELECGLPSVTLLGTKEDWVSLRSKLARLPSFGEEPTTWSKQLDQILLGMINTFDGDKREESVGFWQRIAHHQGGGSGPSWWSGWITGLCFWDSTGECLYHEGPSGKRTLKLNGVDFHLIKSNQLPNGFVEVPVKVNDNGHEYETNILAGSFAYQGTSSDNAHESKIDTVQPLSTWLIYKKTDSDATSQTFPFQ
ncbi:MAG: hypothetical protein Q9162_001136 [Coniocarpon cinnabarinum]